MARITDPDFRLRDHYTPPTLPALPKTGLILDELHKPALKLADYLHAEIANPPAAVSRRRRPRNRSVRQVGRA